jgi:hypothetical protein
MRKKILIPTIVIVAGLMLGTIFSMSLLNRKTDMTDSTQIPNSGESSVSTQNSLQTKASISPKTIKVTAKETDIPGNFDSLDKANITINYLNATKTDLTNVQLLFTTSPDANLGISGTGNVRLNEDESARQSRRVFDIPDVKAGESNQVVFSVYGLAKGEHTIYGKITTRQKEETTILPLQITVN